jgi:hypothetical protein
LNSNVVNYALNGVYISDIVATGANFSHNIGASLPYLNFIHIFGSNATFSTGSYQNNTYIFNDSSNNNRGFFMSLTTSKNNISYGFAGNLYGVPIGYGPFMQIVVTRNY